MLLWQSVMGVNLHPKLGFDGSRRVGDQTEEPNLGSTEVVNLDRGKAMQQDIPYGR